MKTENTQENTPQVKEDLKLLNAPLHIVIPAKIRPIRRYSDRFLILRGSSFVRRIDAVLSSFSAMTVARCQKVYFFVSQSRHCT